MFKINKLFRGNQYKVDRKTSDVLILINGKQVGKVLDIPNQSSNIHFKDGKVIR